MQGPSSVVTTYFPLASHGHCSCYRGFFDGAKAYPLGAVEPSTEGLCKADGRRAAVEL